MPLGNAGASFGLAVVGGLYYAKIGGRSESMADRGYSIYGLLDSVIMNVFDLPVLKMTGWGEPSSNARRYVTLIVQFLVFWAILAIVLSIMGYN